MTEDDLLLHLERTVTSVKADTTLTKPGTKVTLEGGGNRLTIESTGESRNDKMLRVNDVEVVLSTTVKAYAQAIIDEKRSPPTTQETQTMKWTGAGNMIAPLEAVVKLPIGSETVDGVVKVVNEGSHGYPAAGYSWGATALVHDPDAPVGTRYMMLRNGADDLERDVFISWVELDPMSDRFKYTATADRFRPTGLPITAKPVQVEHSCNEAVLLMTTDGPFILVTGNSLDTRKWICRKIPNAELQALEWNHFAFVRNGTLYIISPTKDNAVATLEVWSGPLAGQGDVQLTKRQITGVNGSRRQVTADKFPVFDKVIGAPGEQAYCTNADPTITSLDTVRIIHAPWKLRGNCYSYINEGNVLRISHRGMFYISDNATAVLSRAGMSYTLNLDTMAFAMDLPEKYPISVTMTHISFKTEGFFDAAASDYTNCILSNNGRIFVYDTYGPNTPNMLEVKNNSGMSVFENARIDRHEWESYKVGSPVGLYGTILKMGFRGISAIGDNTIVGASSSGDETWSAKYDPYGSYSPTIPGYGPTNDRKLISRADYTKFNNAVYEFDGDGNKINGYNFTQRSLDGPSTFEDGVFGNRMFMTQATYARLTTEIMAQVGHGIPAGEIYETNLQLGVWRNAKIPCVGSLAIVHVNPDNRKAKRTTLWFFQFEPNARHSEIKTARYMATLQRVVWSNSTLQFIQAEEWCRASPPLAHRLLDGTYAISAVNSYLSVIGDGQFGCPMGIYDPYTKTWHEQHWSITSGSTMEGYLGTKELGIGWVVRLTSAEGVYLDSFGNTRAQVAQSWSSGNRKRYCLLMTRSDAGDNVAISQYAGTKIRDRIQSLVPPSRRINNMDLSQDRTVTKAQIGGDRVPNQTDSSYPVQQKHRSSLGDSALATHSHTPDQFQMAAATTATYGASVLGGLAGADASAFRVDGLSDLEHACDAMFSRPVELQKIDMSLTVDFEV